MTFWGVEVKLSLPHTSILLNYILKALFFSGLLHYVAYIQRYCCFVPGEYFHSCLIDLNLLLAVSFIY